MMKAKIGNSSDSNRYLCRPYARPLWIVTDNTGFTLIELLVALAMGSVFLMIVSVFFYFQQTTYITQQQLSAMQNHTRAAKHFIESELRAAGYDPTGKAGAAIVAGEKGRITFQMDWDRSGKIDAPNETITYALKGDSDGDGRGDADHSACHLGRNNGSGLQTIAENIDALNFVYFDAAHNRIGDADGTVPPDQLKRIRSVQVSVVARSGDRVPVLFRKYIDARVYQNKAGEVILGAPHDPFRRIQIVFEVYCRNLKFSV